MFLVAFLTLHYFSGYIYDFQGADAAVYGAVARNIVERNSPVSIWILDPWRLFQRVGWLPQNLTWKTRPIYVYTIAFFFRIFGSSFWTMKLVNVTLGSLLVIPVFYLTKALFDREKAIVASVFSFLYPLLVIGSIVPGDKILNALTVTSAIAFLAGGTKIRNVLLGGIFCGLAFLARYDFGVALFLSGFILYSLGAHLEGGPLKKRAVASGLFSVAFALTILPWLIRNKIVLGYGLAITGVTAQVFTGSDAVYLSPELLLGAFGAFFLIGMLVSSLLLAIVPLIRKHLSEHKKVAAVLFTGSIVIALTFLFVGTGLSTFVFSLLSIYPQLIYKTSPLIFVFALVGAVASARKIGPLHPTYTLLVFIIPLYTILQEEGGGLFAVYMIPYIPLATTFAASAVFDISLTLSRSSTDSDLLEVPKRVYTLRQVWTPKHLMLTFLIGSIFLSFIPHYLIIAQADKVQKGPFLLNNWDKAYDWISANTYPNDTIMARFPPVAFYTGRRTIALEPMSMTQLLVIMRAGKVSYLIVDKVAYTENKGVDNSIIPWLYDYPESFSIYDLRMQVESPRLQIFGVREVSMENVSEIAWSDHNFTSGWIVDPGLTFESDGDFVVMAYDNTNGSETAFLRATKALPSPIRFSEYPFIIIRFRFNYWTTPSYPPPVYFRGFLIDSNGTEFSSDTAPRPVEDDDTDWHTLLWSPLQAVDIAKMTLLIRVGKGAEFSVIVDYVVISNGPVYLGG